MFFLSHQLQHSEVIEKGFIRNNHKRKFSLLLVFGQKDNQLQHIKEISKEGFYIP